MNTLFKILYVKKLLKLVDFRLRYSKVNLWKFFEAQCVKIVVSHNIYMHTTHRNSVKPHTYNLYAMSAENEKHENISF